jgi:hypothetical protein
VPAGECVAILAAGLVAGAGRGRSMMSVRCPAQVRSSRFLTAHLIGKVYLGRLTAVSQRAAIDDLHWCYLLERMRWSEDVDETPAQEVVEVSAGKRLHPDAKGASGRPSP